MLRHKGYTGHVELDDEARVFHGGVVDLRGLVTFQDMSVEDLGRAFWTR